VIGLFGALRALVAPPRPIPEPLWQATLQRCVLIAALPAAQQARLRDLAARFLAKKRFAGARELELDDGRCLIIAALACLPVLNLGFDYLKGWREVIVYADEFRVRREEHDEHTGVVTEGDDMLIGEAWEHGPLILSWADIETDLNFPHDGLNVVVHEIAHKLDMRDGPANGVPPLPPHIDRREWVSQFQQAYDAHCRAVNRGRETAIDPYAAEAADEYFACVSEMHFSAPRQLNVAAPAVGRLLRAFYDGPANG
jgi:Mlc titration factor MtfA (ptsG expression regulator)